MNKFFKVLVIALCVVLLVAGSVAATLAYLTMKTNSVQNTFTAGNIDIDLTPTEEINIYKMMPGMEYEINPKVTVKQGSEKCWLFIKIDEKIDEPAKFEDYLTYELAAGWSKLESASGVYYRVVEATTDTAKTFDIIKDNKVTANADRTKAEYNALNTQSLNLNFTAYAVQYVGFENAEALAWAKAKALDTTTETGTETGTETENPENKG